MPDLLENDPNWRGWDRDIPEGWCDADHPEHDWTPGDLECRRCQADLSEWNETVHDATAVRESGRFPWVARCTCGWRSPWGYVAKHAAQGMADSHNTKENEHA